MRSKTETKWPARSAPLSSGETPGASEEGRVGGGYGEGEGIVMRPEIGHTIDPVKDVLRVGFPSESNTLLLAHARVRPPAPPAPPPLLVPFLRSLSPFLHESAILRHGAFLFTAASAFVILRPL